MKLLMSLAFLNWFRSDRLHQCYVIHNPLIDWSFFCTLWSNCSEYDKLIYCYVIAANAVHLSYAISGCDSGFLNICYPWQRVWSDVDKRWHLLHWKGPLYLEWSSIKMILDQKDLAWALDQKDLGCWTRKIWLGHTSGSSWFVII